ncbi:MAG: YlxR family protein [Clostridia bacterium]|nr:YlxR family protein [Clostridia bacterium]
MLPQRMCAVCRERKEKSQLIRITKTQDGEVLIDKTGKLQGRGMYICKDGDCIEKAERRHVIERAFSGKVDKEIYDSLAKQREVGKNE